MIVSTSHQRRDSRRWWDILAAFGTSLLISRSGLELLSVFERAQSISAVGINALPLYFVGALGGGLVARSPVVATPLAALLLIERCVRYAPQIQIVLRLGDLSSVEELGAQLIILAAGLFLGTAIAAGWNPARSASHDPLAVVGYSFVGETAVLFAIRVDTLFLGGNSTSVLLLLAMTTFIGIVGSLHLLVESPKPWMSALVAVVTTLLVPGGMALANIQGRPFDRSAIAEFGSLATAVATAVSTSSLVLLRGTRRAFLSAASKRSIR